MSNLKEIKRKIKSVHNTQKTTNAMKLVSTAKLKKAEEAAKRARLYEQKLEEMLSKISFQLNKIVDKNDERFVFFHQKEQMRVVDIIFITADKGLCGGFNIKTIKAVNELLNEYKSKNISIRLKAVGKTGIEFFNFQKIPLEAKFYHLSSSPSYEKACEVIQASIDDYLADKTDGVVLVHNGYKNMITQELKIANVIPVEPLEVEESHSALEFEPEGDDLLQDLMKTYFEYHMYYALIDSLAAEHSARMQAMDNATNNAKARVKQLNLAYNKARQESITTELIEIISGVESMK